MVIVSVGVSPENALAKDAGLALGVKGAIAVSDNMQTSDEDIYAVGDAVEVENFISKDKAVNCSNALKDFQLKSMPFQTIKMRLLTPMIIIIIYNAKFILHKCTFQAH